MLKGNKISTKEKVVKPKKKNFKVITGRINSGSKKINGSSRKGR